MFCVSLAVLERPEHMLSGFHAYSCIIMEGKELCYGTASSQE